MFFLSDNLLRVWLGFSLSTHRRQRQGEQRSSPSRACYLQTVETFIQVRQTVH